MIQTSKTNELIENSLTEMSAPIETPGADPKEKPEIEPEHLPKEDPGIQPPTEPQKEDDDDDDDDDPFTETEIGDDPNEITKKTTIMRL